MIPISNTGFQAFAQTKGLSGKVIGDFLPPNPPWRLGIEPTKDERPVPDEVEAAYWKALDDTEKQKRTLWCYLATKRDSRRMMLTKHDSVETKGLGHGREAWMLLQQQFRSDESVTAVNAKQLLVRLQQMQDEALHNFFLSAQNLSARLEYARENLLEPMLNAIVLNSLPESYEHFVVKESFNPASSLEDLRSRQMNFEENRKHMVCEWCWLKGGDHV